MDTFLDESEYLSFLALMLLMIGFAFLDSNRGSKNLQIKKPDWDDSKGKKIAIVASLIAFLPLPFFFGLGDQSNGYFGFCWWIMIPLWLGIYYLWSIGGVKSSI